MQSKEERREVQKKYYEQNKKRLQETQAEYNKNNTTFIGLRFNNYSDWDVVARITSVDSKPSYIRQLIRDDIKRTGFDPGPKPTKPGAPPDPSTLPPVEPVPTVDMDEWRKEHPELIPPEELSKEEALKLLGM